MRASVEHCKAFLFDWDGTLVDSLPIKISNAGSLFAKRFGIEADDVRAAYARHSGVPRRELFDRIAQDCMDRTLTEPEFEQLSAEFTDMNRRRVGAEASLRAGSIDLLAGLRERGHLTFISTATAQEEIDALADAFGISRHCTEVLGSKPGFTKGSVHAGHVTSRYGIPKTDIAGVGDDEQDMRLFREAGITSIGITGTRSRAELEAAGADFVIDSLHEVSSRVV